MTLNFPGPYELRIYITTSNLTGGVLTHTQKHNVVLTEPVTQGESFTTINFEDDNGPVVGLFLDDLVENWLTVLAPLFNNGFSFDAVELWKYPTAQSFDSVFWSSYGPPIAQPSSVTAPHEAGQNIWTFRTAEGGIMRVDLMESITPQGLPLGYDSQTALQKAVVDFVLAGGAGYGAPFVGRDTAYPFSAIRMFPGRNEALFKRRFRP